MALVALATLVVLGCAQPGAPASATPAGRSPPSASVTVELAASGLVFDTAELSVAADVAFSVLLDNRDRDVHTFEVRDEAGNSHFRGELFGGPAERLMQVPALRAGSCCRRADGHRALPAGVVVISGAEQL